MRLNIEQIIKATKCSEDQANLIETYINDNALIDWSECDMEEISFISKYAKNQIL